MFEWISLFCFIGLICGLGLGFRSPEELRNGRVFFIWIFRALVFALFSFLFYGWIGYYGLLVSAIITFTVAFRWKFMIIFYNVLPIIHGISFYYGMFFDIISGLIFLIGFPIGSIFVSDYEKDDEITVPKKTVIKKLLSKFFFYLIIAGAVTISLSLS